MKIFRIVLVLCVLNTFIIAQEEAPITKEEGKESSTTEEPKVNTAARDKMSQDVKDYFTAEKEAAIYYLGAGALTTSMGLYYRNEAQGYYPNPLGKKSDFAYNTGLSYPLLGVGLFQLATGGLMYFRSDKRAKDLDKELDSNPANFKEQELKRMEQVTDWNKIYRYTEYAMIGGGLLALYSGQLSDKDYMKGFGTGLFIQGVVMYALDYFSSKRADSYKEKLVNFNFSYIPPAKNQNTYAINNLGPNGATINEGYYMFTFTYKLK
jgi:hypothetical protein